MSRLFCTIITKNYLAWARALTASLRAQLPEAEMVVFLLDPIDGCFDASQQPFQVCQAEELLDHETYRNMCFYYSPSELSCAMRPFVHQSLLARPGVEELYYFDSDVIITGPLDPIFQAMQDCQILLTPHMRQPVPAGLDRHVSLEVSILRYGLYNGGFLGLRAGSQSAAFLKWWGEHLLRECFCDYRGLFVDQLWLNLAPLLFQDCKIAQLPGANLGYWNLHEQPAPVPLFIHLSGWDPQRPDQVGNFFPNCRAIPAFQEWGPRFRDLLEREHWAVSRQYPYGYGRYQDGQPIQPAERRLYFELWEAGRWKQGDPFQQREFLQRVLNPGPPWLRWGIRTLRRIANKLESWAKP